MQQHLAGTVLLGCYPTAVIARAKIRTCAIRCPVHAAAVATARYDRIRSRFKPSAYSSCSCRRSVTRGFRIRRAACMSRLTDLRMTKVTCTVLRWPYLISTYVAKLQWVSDLAPLQRPLQPAGHSRPAVSLSHSHWGTRSQL